MAKKAEQLPEDYDFSHGEFPKGTSPREVLYEKMVFYNSKANTLVAKIVEIIENSDKARGDLLTAMYKNVMAHNDIAIECATKLAPYCHPRLESIESKTVVEHSFVVKVPMVVKDSAEWLSLVKPQEIALKQIN